ncbi:MAG: two-component system response regulator [Acidobacteria bacterium]|nr:MAG: two-component system response regulator [Acidobacteriota bacterium]
MSDGVLLLVEDDANDEALTLRALSKNGIRNEIVVIRDGVEALDYLFGRNAYAARDVSELPAVMLLDLKLPKIDGLEVLRRVRAYPRTRWLPIVILTSSNEDRDRAEGYSLGANSYVRKPVEFTEFASAVQQLGVYRLLLNEPPPPVHE